ncbi:MAG: ROK family protein [Chitinophagales bacterium]|nr:ROK family protein [Chitinophagales bacterium]
MDYFIGIDIGGTFVKMAVVNEHGTISNFEKFHTRTWVESSDGFISKFKSQLKEYLHDHPNINKVGIGVPGLVDLKRRTILEVPAIPQINGLNLHSSLKDQFPAVSFVIENDAGAAAIGEVVFRKSRVPDDFIFLTIGTGIGGAAIMDRQLFMGAGGNSMEFGHCISRDQKHLEDLTAKRGILAYASSVIEKFPDSSLQNKEIKIPLLVEAAQSGDEFASHVFEYTGFLLGEGLVAPIRIMDIKHIIIGGGISVAYEFILTGVKQALDKYLTPYYLNELEIEKAELGNNAGLIGAVGPFLFPGITVVHS